MSEPCDHEFGVLHVAYDDRPDIVIDAKDISDGVCHDQTIRDLLLGANDYRVVAAKGDRGLPESLDSLKGILHLVDATIR